MRRRLRAAAAAVGALGLVVTLLAALPGVAAAADGVTFGDPSATSVFGTGITFTQPVTAPGVEAKYVEILIQRPQGIGPEVHTISQIGDISSSTFEYSLREADSHLYPNTTFSARWRVTDTAGNVFVGPSTTVTYTDTRFNWQTEVGDLVRVHWYKGDAAFGKRALAIGEAGIAKAEQLLGVKETDPVDFYVYADLQPFYDALGPGTRENVGGEALPDIRTLFALITPDQIDQSWVGVVIPHELTHLVFDTAIHNPYHDPPHWLNEGLAVYLTQGYDASDRQAVKDAVAGGTIIPLSGLAGQFPTSREKFSLGYSESVSAVDFMIRTYGRNALVKLIQSYATGVTDDAAFSGALGVDAGAFDDAWLADVGAKAPTALGPQPDPTGPLPSGWASTPETAPVAVPTASPTPAASAPAGSGSASSGVPGSPGASGAPAASGAAPSAAASVPLPTLGLGALAATPAASAGGPPALAQPTPGVIPVQPVVSRQSNAALAALFLVLALVLAGLGLGLLAVRRDRSPTPH